MLFLPCTFWYLGTAKHLIHQCPAFHQHYLNQELQQGQRRINKFDLIRLTETKHKPKDEVRGKLSLAKNALICLLYSRSGLERREASFILKREVYGKKYQEREKTFLNSTI